MINNAVQGPWGIAAPLEFLRKAVQSWGPKPFFFDVKSLYDGTGCPQKSSLVTELEDYFKAKLCSDSREFCRTVHGGFVLNLNAADKQLAAMLYQCSAQESATVFDGAVAAMMWNLVTQLEEQTLQREIFYQALNSTAEAIQIANAQGIEIFINAAFLKLTDLKMEDRLGKNVYDVSPDGGMAHVLKHKVQVKNLRNTPKGTRVEMVSNAGPIFVNGEFYGAVTVARDITEISRLSKELEESRQTVELLDKKVGQLASAKYAFEDIIGSSPQIREVVDMARRAASRDLTVLIQGESGTGKEIFAHAIHNCSPRIAGPFIPVNCAAIPEQLMESEFFGYEKGAFTSANSRKPGLFDLANTGTLFLDEIGEMNLSLQSKLLRVLQDKQYIRVGGSKPVKADVRIVAATNRDLSALVQDGKFREDLFYRLNVITLVIPPLRDRPADLEDIASYLIRRICARIGGPVQELGSEALHALASYSWPGNVRELENVLERAVFLCRGNVIRKDDIYLPAVHAKRVRDPGTEKEMIRNCLQKYGHSVEGKRKAAKQLNISLATLYNKIKFYHLNDFGRHSF